MNQSEAQQLQHKTPTEIMLDRLFLLGLLCAVGFVLWLPVFPTGDGPVHLYYANVLWGLVRHQPAYAQDYAIRHLFAPYLVHYLALISFEHLVSPPMAEKLFIAIIFLTTGFGFRFLARTLGHHAGIACVWVLPLLFSWSIGGGFLNCCFATGVALWALGVWTLLGARRGSRDTRARKGWLLLAYACLLGVLVLSHPVPLLVLLLFTASDLLLRSLLRRFARVFAGDEPGHWSALLPQVAALALTAMAFVAPVLLAQKGQAAAVLPEIGFHVDVLGELVTGARLGLFAGITVHTLAGWLALVSRIGLIAIVPGTLWLLARPFPCAATGEASQARVVRVLACLRTSAALRLVLICVIFLASTVFFPRSLNHSYFFPQRMWDIVWLLVLACASASRLSKGRERWLAIGGLVAAVLVAVTGLPALATIARAQAELAAAPLPAGERGLFLEPDSAVDGHGAATTYPVYAWSGARAFAASHAILLNSPWLGLTILPVRDADAARGAEASHALLDRGLPSLYSENPQALTRELATPRAGDADRQKILARADFLLYVNPRSLGTADAGESTRAAALALLGAAGAAWHCEAHDFYALCTQAR